MDLIKYYIRKIKQKFKLNLVPSRPVLDLIDFGSKECVILDVGANRGGFAGNILLHAPLATVHCFEPNQELYLDLKNKATLFGRNLGKPRCHVVGVGVGENNEKREFTVSKFHASSSFLPTAEATKKGWSYIDFSEHKKYYVDIIRLDSYLDEHDIKDVKLLKLDIQGFELYALRGCGERIKDVEYIVSEIQFIPLYEGAPIWTEIVDYLRLFDFQPILMDGFCFDSEGNPLQADILFSRSTS
ncbi:FkbM family methyltransferase [Anabaenopsis tanganyikae CS-531]|uniref:FkbM family methyltransferase n=1 Tax=Anabaenopsis tanganyikae CS-531 TaxID=2785304 RepID=A0ABT6KE61_9CYAN|nr:FkbM family methyltransferase [Anabaenopsis tanganyikae]MDH6106152.1 FkbM family methyltransferase [Anabaenopsis tanganyikae CS-531]